MPHIFLILPNWVIRLLLLSVEMFVWIETCMLYMLVIKEERSLTCRWLLTWASVRSFTFISSNTDFGVAPRRCGKNKSKVSEPSENAHA
jgi:hypothetical protein